MCDSASGERDRKAAIGAVAHTGVHWAPSSLITCLYFIIDFLKPTTTTTTTTTTTRQVLPWRAAAVSSAEEERRMAAGAPSGSGHGGEGGQRGVVGAAVEVAVVVGRVGSAPRQRHGTTAGVTVTMVLMRVGTEQRCPPRRMATFPTLVPPRHPIATALTMTTMAAAIVVAAAKMAVTASRPRPRRRRRRRNESSCRRAQRVAYGRAGW